MVRRLCAITAIVSALFLVQPADAMRVSPMVAELTTTGAGSSARIEVGNIGSAPLPFETRITRIGTDENGVLVETEAEEDFLVFPPQGLVSVGGRQVVRLQWVGAPDIPVSHAYYLSIRQLPVATTVEALPAADAPPGVALTVLYNIKALIVVAPPGAAPDVQVVSAAPQSITVPPAPPAEGQAAATEPTQAPGVRIVVKNVGTRYALMSGANWNIEGTDTAGQPFALQLSGNQISQTVGVGYLAPAGGVRTFDVPVGKALDDSKPVTVRFSQ